MTFHSTDDDEPRPCKSCRRMIVFKQLPRKDGTLGRLAPYDADAETCATCNGNGGRVIIVHVLGVGDLNDAVPCDDCNGLGKRYVSHFATCDDPEAFRR